MKIPFKIGNILDKRQQDFLMSIGKLNAVYGILYLIFASFLLYISAPVALIVIKVLFGIGLIAFYFSHFRNVLVELTILVVLCIEIYAYVLLSYNTYPASIFWILLAPNYIFLVKHRVSKVLFFLALLGMIAVTPVFSEYFNLSLLTTKSKDVFNAMTIITGIFILIINFFIIEQYIITHSKHNEILKRKNDELVEIKNDLIDSRNFQEKFFASVSHELRTPISTIAGAVDLLKDQNVNSELAKCLKDSSHSLSMLIDDFLEFHKIKNGEIKFKKQAFSINDKLSKIASVFNFQFQEKNLNFELHISKKTPEYIIGDSKRLSQILLNIIGNCIKYTENGNINLNISPLKLNDQSTALEFLIVCKGRSIRKNLKTSAHQDYNLNIHSVLGLDWTKKIIESNGGQLEIVKLAKDLYQYKVILHFDRPNENFSETEKKLENIMSPSDLKILIVDDNPINLAISKKQILLHESLYQISTAQDGMNCLDLCEVNKYNIILLDIRMPKISGIEVAKRLRNSEENPNQNTPIIALTADVTDKTVNECNNVGIDIVVSKPYNIHDLLNQMKILTHEEV